MKTITIENKDKLYFTSDLHLGHANIIQICNRPFSNIEEMDSTLLENWNLIIEEDDTVFVLGDFSWRLGNSQIHYYINRLKGNKVFIKGNHDKNEKAFPVLYDGFINIKVRDSDDKKFQGYQHITLCHYPMLSWYQSHRGAWQLFGHWHTLPDNQPLRRVEDHESDYIKEEYIFMDRIRQYQYDVGVDQNNYAPVSYNTIKNYFMKNLENSK